MKRQQTPFDDWSPLGEFEIAPLELVAYIFLSAILLFGPALIDRIAN